MIKYCLSRIAGSFRSLVCCLVWVFIFVDANSAAFDFLSLVSLNIASYFSSHDLRGLTNSYMEPVHVHMNIHEFMSFLCIYFFNLA